MLCRLKEGFGSIMLRRNASSPLRRTAFLSLAAVGLFAIATPKLAVAQEQDQEGQAPQALNFEEGTFHGLIPEDFGLDQQDLDTLALGDIDLDALSKDEMARLGRAAVDLGVCGKINIRANARCEVSVKGGCEAKCKPLNFRLECSAQLQVQCGGQCNASIEQSCQKKCTDVCIPECTVDPGKVDCGAKCQVNCDASCTEECKKYPQDPYCMDTCKANCGANCKAECQATLPSASCQDKCTKVCGADCKTQANLSCQVQCSASGRAKCEADLSGGCKVKCSRPEGALFCDGQFVDTNNNLRKCVSALNAYLKSKVMVHADADVDCSKGMCTARAEAGVSCKCTANNAQDPRQLLWALFALPGLMWATGRRPKGSRCDE